jgi:ATP/maltotriose-dependent transcriptional regulator MalT
MTGKILRRQLATEIVNSTRPLALLKAPQGYGKSIIALQVYEQWVGSRLWVNVEHLEDHEFNSHALLHEIALWIGIELESRKTILNIKQLAVIVADELNEIDQPLLVVFDGVQRNHSDRLLKMLYALSALIPNRHKLLITCDSGTLSPNEKTMSLGNIQKFSTSVLKFSTTEVSTLTPINWVNDVNYMRLISECEGWPALIGLLLRLEQEGLTSHQLERELTSYVTESLSTTLSEETLKFVPVIAESSEIDVDLVDVLHGQSQRYVSELIDCGFLIEKNTSRFQKYYVWPKVVRTACKSLPTNDLSGTFDLYRLIAWADRTERWSDGLNFSLMLDTNADIAHRLIHTGRYVQEQGKAKLLREALLRLNDNPLNLEDSMELLFIELAAYAMQPSDILQKKIQGALVRIETLPQHLKSQYLVWIECVQAQYAMRKFNIEQARYLAKRIENDLSMLPVYYQVQALSALGEASLNDGDLYKALAHYERGSSLSEKEELPSSYLWHMHQQAQIQTLMGQANVAENIRFSAIQRAHELNGRQLFPYECLLRAHCESLLNEVRIQEVLPVLTELEQRTQAENCHESLPINFLRLEYHQISCLLDSSYQAEINDTVNAIERSLLGGHHPHVKVRAERTLLNHWHQTEKVHQILQWYIRQNALTREPTGPDALIHLRNLVYAFLVLEQYGMNVERKWPLFSILSMNEWLNSWPNLAPMACYLFALSSDHLEEVQKHQLLVRSMGNFSQTNFLSEPLSYDPSWLDPIVNGLFPIQRFQQTFISRVNALWGNRTKYRVVRNQKDVPNQGANLGLSPREWQLLTCVSKGSTNECIADQLSLSVGTVKNQLTKIYRKLGVTGRTAAKSRFKSMAEAV